MARACLRRRLTSCPSPRRTARALTGCGERPKKSAWGFSSNLNPTHLDRTQRSGSCTRLPVAALGERCSRRSRRPKVSTGIAKQLNIRTLACAPPSLHPLSNDQKKPDLPPHRPRRERKSLRSHPQTNTLLRSDHCQGRPRSHHHQIRHG